MRIRSPPHPPDPWFSSQLGGPKKKYSNTYNLHLLDLGSFKKHIELTYAAVTAAKNECNCIFFRSQVVAFRLAALSYFVWVMSYYSPPEPVRYPPRLLASGLGALPALTTSPARVMLQCASASSRRVRLVQCCLQVGHVYQLSVFCLAGLG
jgi:hypothetical protein